MKFAVALLVAQAMADDTPAKNGTVCTTNKDCDSSDSPTVCCAVATKGMVCGDATCTDAKMTKTAGPNTSFCEATDKSSADPKKIIT